MSTSSKRLLSLDVLRGLTVFGMILVNNGAGHEHFYPLTHSAWNGLTPCDLIFPFFLFMVGLSIPMSNRTDVRRIVWRSVKMFVLGVALHAWDMWIGGKEDIIGNLRLWGVLERIALCYLAVGVFHHYVKPASHYINIMWGTIIALLVGYGVVLLVGNGYAQDETNIACIIDRWLVGEAHLYHKSPIDPEGLLGTLPSIAHTMIGLYVGWIVKQQTSLSNRLIQLFSLASCLILFGYLISFGLPLNKRIWSPSYVLVTCGFASSLLGLLILCVDSEGISKDKSSAFLLHLKNGLFQIFTFFGLNAIALYVISEMLAPVMGYFGVGDAMSSWLIDCGLSPQFSSLCYALSFDLLMTLIAWLMYRRRLFIKL